MSIVFNSSPYKQRGMALVLSLFLLVICLSLGMASVQLSHVDERMAGNHRDFVLARMAAEKGLSEAYPLVGSLSSDVSCSFSEGWFVAVNKKDYDEGRGDYEVCYQQLGGSIALKSRGLYGAQGRQAERIVEGVFTAPSLPPGTGLVGCEGFSMNGGSRIGSYDSTSLDGEWDPQNPGRKAAIRVLDTKADVVLDGNEKIYGDVYAAGNVFVEGGSSEVFGNVNSGGDVAIGGNSSIHGDVKAYKDIGFNGTGMVDGSLLANGNISFQNYSSFVGGDVQAGGSVDSQVRNPEDHVAGKVQEYSSPNNSLPLLGSCDSMDIKGEIENYSDLQNTGPLTTGGWPYSDWVITPENVSRYNNSEGVKRREIDESRDMHEVEVLGRKISMLKTGDFNLTYEPLTISGGDVALFVDGDLNLGTGGGEGLIIDDDSTLTIFVTGKTLVSSAISMDATNSVNNDGDPIFSIYSSKEDKKNETGVVVNGGANLVANVYAPYANVSVNSGGGVFGAFRGKTLDVYGDGTLAIDEGLNKKSSDGKASESEFVSWQEE